MQFWRRIPIHVDKEFLIFGGDVFRGFSCNLYDEKVDGKLAQRSPQSSFQPSFRSRLASIRVGEFGDLES